MAAQQLGQVEPGTSVTIKENGQLENYIVLHQGAYTQGEGSMSLALANLYSGMENTTLLIRADLSIQDPITTNKNTMDFSTCQALTWLKETFLPYFSEDIQGIMKEITFPYRYVWETDGDVHRNEDRTMSSNVFLPSRYEVTAVFETSAERIANFDGSPSHYWCRDGSTGSYSDGTKVEATTITKTGTYGTAALFNSAPSNGYRPVIALDSIRAYVTEEGEVVANTPPEITGTDDDLGSFGETSPTYRYTVTDQQGGTVTVTEALDGETLRTYDVTLGQQNTLTIPADVYRRTLNGMHTLTVTAEDSVGARTVRTLTFTKNVTSCAFTQTTAFAADDRPTRCVINIQGSFPEGSVLTVQICNNGNDASPTWETITEQALLGQKYFFKNETKTADAWGVKVQASLERGTAEGDCFISSIGGVFQ